MVVTMLQLLLANVTSNTTLSLREIDEETGPGTPQESEATIIDNNREKEVLAKGITGVLILLLKWFRASRMILPIRNF